MLVVMSEVQLRPTIGGGRNVGERWDRSQISKLAAESDAQVPVLPGSTTPKGADTWPTSL
jgi:hypothetical protein